MKTLFTKPVLKDTNLEVPQEKRVDILIDVSNFAYRAAFAYKDLSHEGTPTGHIFGGVSSLLGFVREWQHLGKIKFVFCLDGKPVFRKTKFPEYKAGRAKKALDYNPVTEITKLLTLLPGEMLLNKEEEADDVIAAYLKNNYSKQHVFVLNSSDADLWTLKNRYNLTIVGNQRKTVEPEQVEEKFFTNRTEFIPLVKAIIGDAGDNLPKVLRFPRKDLSTILSYMKTPTVSGMIETGNKLYTQGEISERAWVLLNEHEKQMHLTFELASLREDVQYETTHNSPNKDMLKKILTDAQCFSLLSGLDSLY